MIERVTVTIPSQIRTAAMDVARSQGVPFSTVVTDALQEWLRSCALAAWLEEHQREDGHFDEAELQALAAETGVPYLPPGAP